MSALLVPVQTTPGKSWSVLLRLYGPLEPWFEKAWKPGDLELGTQRGAKGTSPS